MRLLGSFDLHRRNIFIVSQKCQLLKSFDANQMNPKNNLKRYESVTDNFKSREASAAHLKEPSQLDVAPWWWL